VAVSRSGKGREKAAGEVAGEAAATVDDYIAGFPPETRRLLEELRAVIRGTIPAITERISYRMPTFDLHKRPLVYMAGFAGHVGMYPIIGPVADALVDELAPYKYGKGTVRFALAQPLPTALVRRIVELRAAEIEAALTAKAAKAPRVSEIRSGQSSTG